MIDLDTVEGNEGNARIRCAQKFATRPLVPGDNSQPGVCHYKNFKNKK